MVGLTSCLRVCIETLVGKSLAFKWVIFHGKLLAMTKAYFCKLVSGMPILLQIETPVVFAMESQFERTNVVAIKIRGTFTKHIIFA